MFSKKDNNNDKIKKADFGQHTAASESIFRNLCL